MHQLHRPELSITQAAAHAVRLQGRCRQEGMAALSWSRAFPDPILLSDGTELVTLRDSIAWLAKKVPQVRHSDPDIQLAAWLVEDAAERGGILMMAEIAMRKVAAHKQSTPAGQRRRRVYKIVG